MREYGLDIIERSLRDLIDAELTRAGILYRLFSRVKDQNSIQEKIARKNYQLSGKRVQDLIGFRIVTYFNDDIKPIIDLCQKKYIIEELVYDNPDAESFKPLRKNMICKLPEKLSEILNEIKVASDDYDFVDNTFEIQFRTTLSEGWHEVDHNLRYKCKEEWVELDAESRMLNGIYASLETSDQALKALFDDIAYHHYKQRNWEAMMRNKFRLRFKMGAINQELLKVLNKDLNIGKLILKSDRNALIKAIIDMRLTMSLTFDNVLYFINYCFIKNPAILDLTPQILKDELIDLNLVED